MDRSCDDCQYQRRGRCCLEPPVVIVDFTQRSGDYGERVEYFYEAQQPRVEPDDWCSHHRFPPSAHLPPPDPRLGGTKALGGFPG
jgi:hypothetical protein